MSPQQYDFLKMIFFVFSLFQSLTRRFDDFSADVFALAFSFFGLRRPYCYPSWGETVKSVPHSSTLTLGMFVCSAKGWGKCAKTNTICLSLRRNRTIDCEVKGVTAKIADTVLFSFCWTQRWNLSRDSVPLRLFDFGRKASTDTQMLLPNHPSVNQL